MNRTKEEYIALLDETRKYYEEDPNRVSTSIDYSEGVLVRCKYFDARNQNKYAVGRCLIDAEKFADVGLSVQSYASLNGEYLENEFKEEYRGFDIDFWQQLQNFHDCTNWKDNNFIQRYYNQVLQFIENKFQ